MPYLEIHHADGSPKYLALDANKVTIGRDASNTVALQDDKASRAHCELEPQGNHFLLRDLQSRNGTWVDSKGVKVTEARIGAGLFFRVGRTHMRIVGDNVGRQAMAAQTAAAHDSAAPVGAAQSATRTAPRQAGAQAQPQAATTSRARQDFSTGSIEALAYVGHDVGYTAEQIGLINARGTTVHTAGAVDDGGKGETAETVRLVRLLLLACIRANASDVHVEPREGGGVVRLRVDGMMVQGCAIDDAQTRRLLSIVKILSDLDITKRQVVQEGHFTSEAPDRRVDYRASFTPAMYGQKLVLRVLDPTNSPRTLEDLHMPQPVQRRLEQLSKQDTGMLLVAGPTGSGKTTSLYALLRQIDAHQRNVVTIEDPIEYALPGATQIPVDKENGHTFQSMLRSVMRQDPDVIMVGEIRDRETAEIAMQAATTGHLVLSTVHAQDTMGTVFRLLDLGVDPYLIGTTINIVLAQRLMRQLCEHCRTQRAPDEEELRVLTEGDHTLETVSEPVGCQRCFDTGFHGRRAIFEMMHNTRSVREVILSSPSAKDLREALESTEYEDLHTSGYQLVRDGVTSLEEVHRVIGE